jgi:hypothetical protein
MMRNGLGSRSAILMMAILCLGSVGWADRTIFATNGDDTLYFGVVDDQGVRKLCVLTKTGSGASSMGVYNMDTGRLTIHGRDGNDRIEAVSNKEVEGVTFLDIALLTFGEIYLYGGAGHDEIFGTPGPDHLYGGPGNDRLVGKEGDDYLDGEDGDDFLEGWAGNDILRGGPGNDYLCGDQGDDELYGEGGDDILVGGTGDDYLDGGPGFDRFWCRTVPTPNPNAHWDDWPEDPASSDCGDTAAPVNVEVHERGNPYSDWVNMARYGNGVIVSHRTTGNPRLLLAYAAAGAVILLSTGGDRPVAGDFDRDGQNDDVAVFRSTTGTWYFDYNHDGTTDAIVVWGQAGDIPLAGDFDGDGRIDDIAVFRPADCKWYFDYNRNGTTDRVSGPWGNPGDLPIAGDFDRDGRCDDVAVFRPANRMWYYDYNANGTTDEQRGPWGVAGDLPIAGDFLHTRQNDDVAVFRPSNGMWYYDYLHDGTTDLVSRSAWGLYGDLPIAGDFSRDGRFNDVGLFRMSDCRWRYSYNFSARTDETRGPWGFVGEPLGATHKQYGNSCGPTSLNMIFEHSGAANRALRRWYQRDLDIAGTAPLMAKWWPDVAVDVGYHLSMEHIMWEWFHEKRRIDPNWSEGSNFIDSQGRLNTQDALSGWLPNDHQGWFYDICYEIGNVRWNASTGRATGPVQKWLKHSPAVGWKYYNANEGLPFVANKFSDGRNDAYPVQITIGSGGRFKSMAHLQAVIEGFINNDIPLVVAVENGGHFNVLIGYWRAGSTYYVYTAEPLDGWGRPFYGKPMRWRRMILSNNLLPSGTGTLAGMMLHGHAVRRGVAADWAQKIDRDYGSNLLCGYLR